MGGEGGPPHGGRFTYTPGEPQIFSERFNLWKPGPVNPRRGDVGHWLELVTDAVKDTRTRELMIQCMAYQVQNRGTRLEKLLYFVGRLVGTGKSTQPLIMKKILGEHNTGWITKTDLVGQYNAIWAAKELVVLDDIEKLKRDTWNKIKTHITSSEVTISEKYMPSRTQANYAAFYVTGNQADILSTDADDRRVLMIPFEPSVLHREDGDPYWPAFFHWLNTGGIEAIAYYLSTLDLSNFDPHFYPPHSAIKADAIESTMDDDEAFLVDFLDDPGGFVPYGRRVITSHELFMLGTGQAVNEFNRSQLKRMSKIISARMYLTKVPIKTKNFIIDKQRTTLYWVPGRSGGCEQVDPGWARKNIKDFAITMN